MLKYGEFIDIQGIDIKAKGFLSNERIGVIIWNEYLHEKIFHSIKMAGYNLTNTYEPDRINIDSASALGANSIRLMVFEISNK